MDLVLNILRDPIWQAIFGFFAILATILLFMADRERKELSILSVSLPHDHIKLDNIEKPVAVSRYVIRLVNSGRLPIVRTDFERSIKIGVNRGYIFEAKISDRQPSSLEPESTFNNREITLEPLLLNPGDEITFEVKYADRLGRESDPVFHDVYLDSRISGVTNFRNLNYRIGCQPVLWMFIGIGVLLVPTIVEVKSWFTARISLDDYEAVRFYTTVIGMMIVCLSWFRIPWIRMSTVERIKTWGMFVVYGLTSLIMRVERVWHREKERYMEQYQSDHGETRMRKQ